MNKAKTADERLRDWLNLSHLTQTALSEALGVSRAAVSKWCSGEMCPSKAHAERIEKLSTGLVPSSLWPRREMPQPACKGQRALREAAAKRGVTITQLSRVTGVPPRAMHRWVVGSHAPRKPGIAMLNATLGLKLTERDFEVSA